MEVAENTNTKQCDKCAKCLSFVGFRYAMALTIGLGIGMVGTTFVEMPPASLLVTSLQLQEHNEEVYNQISQRLTVLETDIGRLKKLHGNSN